MAEQQTEQQPIPWMSPEQTESFLRTIRNGLKKGRQIKPMSFEERREAESHQPEDPRNSVDTLSL